MFVFSFPWIIPEDHGPHSLEPTPVVPPKIKFRGLPRVYNERLPWSKTFRMSFANPSWTQLLKNGKRQSFLQSLSVLSACAFPISNHNLLFQSNSAFKSSKDRMSCKDSLMADRHLKKRIMDINAFKSPRLTNINILETIRDNINRLRRKIVAGINRMIHSSGGGGGGVAGGWGFWGWRKMPCFLNKFSLLILLRNVWRSVWRICICILVLTGLGSFLWNRTCTEIFLKLYR